MMSFENDHYGIGEESKMLIGYARVSTAEQNLNLQKESLKDIGCQKNYEDCATGSYANLW